MKFDKETVICIVVCALFLFAWDPFARMMGWLPPVPTATTAAVSAEAPKAPVAEAKPVVAVEAPAPKSVPVAPAASALVVTPPSAAAVVETAIPLKSAPVTLENSDLAFEIDPAEGAVRSIFLKKFLDSKKENPVVLQQTQTLKPGALRLFDGKKEWKALRIVESRLESGRYRLTRDLEVEGQTFRLTQTWTLAEKGYESGYAVELQNTGKTPLQFADLTLSAAELGSWAQVSGEVVRMASHRMDFQTVDGKNFDLKSGNDDKDFFQVPAPMVNWACVGNKYFCVILDAEKPFALFQGRAWLVRSAKERDEIMTVGSRFPGVQLAANASWKSEFRFYSGPKIMPNIEAFEPAAKRVMHIAWGPLDYLARLLLWSLVKLHALIGSYGVSIICLTLTVRLLLYPITAKANRSMKKMQGVKPKMDEIRAKYRDNPQLQNAKMMELYKTEKINPFGGCLPILLQIPVFFALYAMLEGAVELRQVSFLWAKDLAGPDTIFTIPLFVGGWTLPVNPLALAMTGLMVVQQHITPMSMDPMQKKMMMFMPVVMLLFLYNLPSGLTLYWTVSNIFSIIQLLLQNRANQQPAASGKN